MTKAKRDARPTENYLDALTRAWDNLASKDGHWTDENEKTVFEAVRELVTHLRKCGGIKLSRVEMAQIADCVSGRMDEAVNRHCVSLQEFIKEKVIGSPKRRNPA